MQDSNRGRISKEIPETQREKDESFPGYTEYTVSGLLVQADTDWQSCEEADPW